MADDSLSGSVLVNRNSRGVRSLIIVLQASRDHGYRLSPESRKFLNKLADRIEGRSSFTIGSNDPDDDKRKVEGIAYVATHPM